MSETTYSAELRAKWVDPIRLAPAFAYLATAYAPFCPEHGAGFFILFYCGPTALLAGLGWLAGPRLLRW